MKDESKAGIVAIISCVVIVLLVLFSFAPGAYYLGKWWTYWDSKNTQSSPLDTTTPSQFAQKLKNEGAANAECQNRVKKYFNTFVIYHYASSTNEDFTTYDCYGLKFTKIPLPTKQ